MQSGVVNDMCLKNCLFAIFYTEMLLKYLSFFKSLSCLLNGELQNDTFMK